MMNTSLIQPARVWLRRGALDRRLADGASPAESPELARRARQVTSPRFRAGLAASLRAVVDNAERPRRGLSPVVPVRRDAVLAERELILELAAELESADDLKPRGIVLIERLLGDGASPLYCEGGRLREWLGQARAALHLAVEGRDRL
jgi:hypothetical protein